MTRTYEEKKYMLYIGLLRDIIMKYEGIKTHGTDKLYVQVGGGGCSRL